MLNRREALAAMAAAVLPEVSGNRKLIPVGIDTDGTVKPVENLSYLQTPVMSPSGRRIATRHEFRFKANVTYEWR
jgi:hypothetical protein